MKSKEWTIVKIEFDLPPELIEFFESASKLFEWGFESPENLLKHILLEGLEHRLEHLADSQNLDQHVKLHNLITEERLKCHPEEFIAQLQTEEPKQIPE
ncbi:MAG: hypothetical protein JSW11_08920 [Candidatus Heimdallarchaeota archaeon]|nr:MAG: hypothetical protein JSW11_08920 [Candidatus Heimdallarchaeota archaeon]